VRPKWAAALGPGSVVSEIRAGQSRDLAGERLVLDRRCPVRSLAERGLRAVAD